MGRVGMLLNFVLFCSCEQTATPSHIHSHFSGWWNTEHLMPCKGSHGCSRKSSPWAATLGAGLPTCGTSDFFQAPHKEVTFQVPPALLALGCPFPPGGLYSASHRSPPSIIFQVPFGIRKPKKIYSQMFPCLFVDSV